MLSSWISYSNISEEVLVLQYNTIIYLLLLVVHNDVATSFGVCKQVSPWRYDWCLNITQGLLVIVYYKVMVELLYPSGW